MKSIIDTYRDVDFQSSSQKTQQYAYFEEAAIQELKSKMDSIGMEVVKTNSLHFEFSAFIRNPHNNKYIYLNIGDVRPRWTGARILIRTAKDTNDYRGGSNNFVHWRDLEMEILRLIGQTDTIELRDKIVQEIGRKL